MRERGKTRERQEEKEKIEEKDNREGERAEKMPLTWLMHKYYPIHWG